MPKKPPSDKRTPKACTLWLTRTSSAGCTPRSIGTQLCETNPIPARTAKNTKRTQFHPPSCLNSTKRTQSHPTTLAEGQSRCTSGNPNLPRPRISPPFVRMQKCKTNPITTHFELATLAEGQSKFIPARRGFIGEPNLPTRPPCPMRKMRNEPNSIPRAHQIRKTNPIPTTNIHSTCDNIQSPGLPGEKIRSPLTGRRRILIMPGLRDGSGNCFCNSGRDSWLM